jgi:hypothetical protein
MSQDDLAFNIPQDPTQAPYQVYVKDSSGNYAKRDSFGALSWMATVTPKIEGLHVYRDLYTLSIVVFANRDASMSNVSSVTGKPDNERVVDVTTFYGNGIGGGDVQLKTNRSIPEDLKLKHGDWLMLAGNTPVSGGSTLPLFKWYRVIAAGDDPQPSGGGYTRDVTLHGPDWDDGTVTNTQAVIIRDVAAVFEKTIRLENTSLWSAN